MKKINLKFLGIAFVFLLSFVSLKNNISEIKINKENNIHLIEKVEIKSFQEDDNTPISNGLSMGSIYGIVFGSLFSIGFISSSVYYKIVKKDDDSQNIKDDLKNY